MRSKLTIGLLFFSAFSLAVLHDLSIRLSWNYLYPQIDILLHILAGFVISIATHIAIITMREFSGEQIKRPKKRLLGVMLLATLLIAVLWEVVELVFFLTKDAGLSLETLSDIAFSLVGAFVAWGATKLLAKVS